VLQMKLKFNPVLSGFVLLGIVTNSYAEHTQLDDMTVTATRTEQSALEQPISIGYKKGDEVLLDKAATQKELLNSIAGVRITQTGSSIGHMASIRLPTNTGPYYLFLQDSIPVQSSGFFNHNGLAYTNFSSAGSVEVMKGAGTALYGSDAVAATINVLSVPAFEEQGLTLSGEAGSDGFRRYGVKGGTELNGHSNISANISHVESDGWRDHTEYDRDEFAVNYVNDLDDDNTIKLGLSLNKTEAEMAGDLIGEDEFKHNTESVGNIQSALDQGIDAVRKFDFARFNMEWNHVLSDNVELNSIAYLRRNRNRYIATWENNLPENDSEENTLGLLFKANIDMGRMRNISGLDFEFTKASREYTQLFDYVPSGWGSSVDAGKIYDYDVNYRAFAPYSRLEFALNDKLKLGAGLRYDINSYEYTNNLDDGQYGSSSYSRASSDNDPTFNHLSPKLDLAYQISDSQVMYARYANGFRIPQASRLYSLRTNNIDFSLDEEITDTFEIGYKLQTARHELSGAIYYLVIDDTIVSRENADGDRYYVNGNETTHKGIELSLASELTNELMSKIAYSYSKHEFKDDESFDDNEQAQAPNNVANVRLIYTPKKLAGLTAMLEWEHVGSSWMDDENTKKYDGHDVGNIKVRYDVSKGLAIHARMLNFTDTLYAESANISYGSERYTPGAPRQAYIGFDYKL
jgi:iron complex outermembrane recepter protein